MINEAPTIEPKQGEWETEFRGNGWNDYLDYTCSNCGKKYERADAVLYKANFCPNCGAKMKGASTDIDCFDTCKHAYSEVCDECYKGNKYDAVERSRR